jgi:hypothetical protein
VESITPFAALVHASHSIGADLNSEKVSVENPMVGNAASKS